LHKIKITCNLLLQAFFIRDIGGLFGLIFGFRFVGFLALLIKTYNKK